MIFHNKETEKIELVARPGWFVAGCETMASILSTSGLGQATFHGPQSSRAGGQAASGNPEDLNRLMSSAVKRLSSNRLVKAWIG